MGQGASQEDADGTGTAWQPVPGPSGADNTGTKNSRNYRECSDCGRHAFHHQQTIKPPARVECATCYNAKKLYAEKNGTKKPNERIKMEPTDEEKARIKQLKQDQARSAHAARSAHCTERREAGIAAKYEEYRPPEVSAP